MSKKFIIPVTDDMHTEIKRIARKDGRSMSGLIRKILNEWLKEQGLEINWYLEWGGDKSDDKPTEQIVKPIKQTVKSTN